MPEVATREPLEIRAGDTVTWRREELTVDYPASDSWVLTYYFRGPSQPLNVDAEADGDEFLVTIAATETAKWNPGVYSWLARVSKAGEVHSAGDGQVKVLVNLAADMLNYDGRSFSKQFQQVIEQLCLGKSLTEIAASTGLSVGQIEAYSIGNRSVTYAKKTELFALRDQMRRESAAEDKRAKIAQGEEVDNHIYVRFSNS